MTLDTPDHIHQGCCCWREPTSEKDRMGFFPTSQKFAYPPPSNMARKVTPNRLLLPSTKFLFLTKVSYPPPPPFLQQFSCYNSIKTLRLFLTSLVLMSHTQNHSLSDSHHPIKNSHQQTSSSPFL